MTPEVKPEVKVETKVTPDTSPKVKVDEPNIEELRKVVDKLPEPVMDKIADLINDPVVEKIIANPPKTPVKPPKNPKVPSKQTGLTWPQAMALAGSFGTQQLANVFYYGKDFGAKKHKIDAEGDVSMTPFKSLSVTKAGAELDPESIPIAEAAKEGENDISELLEQIMSSGDNNMTQDDLIQLIQ